MLVLKQPFPIFHGQLMFSSTRLVILFHKMATQKELGHDPKAKEMASHSGKDSTMQKISSRFFWQNIKATSKNLLRNPTNVKSSEKSENYQVSLAS